MEIDPMYMSTRNGAEIRIREPKVIATISICGALHFTITDIMSWNSPTPEQIKNLKDTFNIDVEVYDDNN